MGLSDILCGEPSREDTCFRQVRLEGFADPEGWVIFTRSIRRKATELWGPGDCGAGRGGDFHGLLRQN